MLLYVNVQLTMKMSTGRIFMTTRSPSGFSLLLLTTTTPVEDIFTFPIGAGISFHEKVPLTLTDGLWRGWKRRSSDDQGKIVFNMYDSPGDGYKGMAASQKVFRCEHHGIHRQLGHPTESPYKAVFS